MTPAPRDTRPPAWFVTLEGVEGSGKSSQLERLAERLHAAGIDALVSREPGGTALGERLRALLLDPRQAGVSAWCEMLLYAADRAQHLEQVVEPALAAGRSVICDRYLDATLAYQGYGRELGVEPILAVHRYGPLRRRPHRTVVFDLDPAAALGRARQRDAGSGAAATAGRFEQEQLEFHRRVRRGYLELAASEPQRIVVIDASGARDEVERRVHAALAPLWPGIGDAT